jgi:hypothetical protein
MRKRGLSLLIIESFFYEEGSFDGVLTYSPFGNSLKVQ